MSENTEDRKYMGTKNEAEAKLIAASRAWRETRQPMMGTRADLNANDVAERELRFCLANAALLWLWHQENPDPVLSPVPISSEKMELAQRIEVGLATEVDGSFSPLNREQWIMIVAALRASSPAQEPVTTEPVAQWQWRFKSQGQWSIWINVDYMQDFIDLQAEGLRDGRVEMRALYAIPAPPQPGRDAVIEECAKILDEAAIDWNRIRDPGMANSARSYARKIRALTGEPK
jgi:hypothetical protein